ncbi:hypothetical protein PCANC_04325 [Puccinia coronata f. sp. avenae]|uniref:Mediator of RNA polymerase II transcription subunit 21 n=1 Tax=Puccinia coronata f. sp. avenae TaxID=200324 RepID=A0A2N5VUG6_9BASI|nr:hypothetical protein PCANC_04325 [Puccinia coronata f. sp. avenae]
MTSHDAELSRNMDRITQLQDGVDNLVTIMYSTLSFLSRKADFKQVNPDIPISQAIPCPEGTQPTQETFNQNCEELVQDFLRKAKQIEYLISILPPHNQQETPSANHHPPDTNHASSSNNNPQQNCHIPNKKEAATDIPQPKPNSTNQSEPSETKDSEEEEDSEEFEQLQADLHAAQHEYDDALLDAEDLRTEIKTALRQILDQRVRLLSSSSSSSSGKNPNG